MITRRHFLAGSAALALRAGTIDDAAKIIEPQVKSGQVRAVVLAVQQGKDVTVRAFGDAKDRNAVFLLASISKPMTCTAVMTLADRRELSVEDRVSRLIPEFKGDQRDQVLIRHLLTHTSGLPDMLPENTELRKKHAPLSDFVAGTCRTPLLFKPGSQVKYQSMGILLAAEIVQRITKQPLPEYLRTHVYRPLKMNATSLGLGGRSIASTMQSQVEEQNDYDWNSSYWRNLASPWGGAHSTAEDIMRFLRYFVQRDAAVLKPETAAAMIANQTPGMKESYGFGWARGGNRFAKPCSASTYGHGGSTGTLCWLDPAADRSFVLLTTKPAAQSQKPLIRPVSEAIAAQTT